MTFQDLIFKLSEYWAAQGCLIQQPLDTEMGAGTMHPETFLRVLGPTPWSVAYVQPSRRPADGRFGENPNRLFKHHQFQVILKPAPDEVQDLYLQSLEACGIDLRAHDVRFEEDNWESPTLGAWGIGWQVLYDGMEITQFTYFQQAGGHDLDPVAVELTYGLERILMALLGKESVWDMEWGSGITYGDVLLQSEIEHCKYYFDVADVDALRQMYDTCETEAKRALEAGLVIPAHDYNLKCSHLFNVLDARGSIGVTERATFFRRMRDTSRRISAAYIEQRQRLEYPFMKVPDWETRSPVAPSAVSHQLQSSAPTPFLLEIGTEELPSGDLSDALSQL
ncbi:MAG: glycine--tRNA ligase subunit alpha, partial [Acidobacteria bacterium]|nr:glycine--tRNA ligase subunit alpha [Acidobacteriota bacterium]